MKHGDQFGHASLAEWPLFQIFLQEAIVVLIFRI